jgi:diguanylate cyclase (GGDEF)-like protein
LTKAKKVILYSSIHLFKEPLMVQQKRTKEEALTVQVRWLQRKCERLEQRYAYFRQVAYYDDLCKEADVLSRYGFMQRLKARLTEVDERTRRHGIQHHALLYIDLDKFKQVNDQFGHHAGDLVLQTFASAVHSVLRGSDILGRIGGDEFAVVARVFAGHGLRELKRRVQRALAGVSVTYEGKEIAVSASVGGTLLKAADPHHPEKLLQQALKRADEDMYREKQLRR